MYIREAMEAAGKPFAQLSLKRFAVTLRGTVRALNNPP